MTNQELSLIKSSERAPDGNLLPETRACVIQSIKKHLQKVGYLNISDISGKLGLSRQTTRKLVDEIIDAWREESKNQIMPQLKYYHSVLNDMDENPETFDKDKIELIKLRSAVFGKINSLMKIMVTK